MLEVWYHPEDIGENTSQVSLSTPNRPIILVPAAHPLACKTSACYVLVHTAPEGISCPMIRAFMFFIRVDSTSNKVTTMIRNVTIIFWLQQRSSSMECNSANYSSAAQQQYGMQQQCQLQQRSSSSSRVQRSVPMVRFLRSGLGSNMMSTRAKRRRLCLLYFLDDTFLTSPVY